MRELGFALIMFLLVWALYDWMRINCYGIFANYYECVINQHNPKQHRRDRGWPNL